MEELIALLREGDRHGSPNACPSGDPPQVHCNQAAGSSLTNAGSDLGHRRERLAGAVGSIRHPPAVPRIRNPTHGISLHSVCRRPHLRSKWQAGAVGVVTAGGPKPPSHSPQGHTTYCFFPAGTNSSGLNDQEIPSILPSKAGQQVDQPTCLHSLLRARAIPVIAITLAGWRATSCPMHPTNATAAYRGCSTGLTCSL